MVSIPKLHTLFMAGFALYTGKVVKEIKVHADPQVKGTYGMRATYEDGSEGDFLIIGQYIDGGIGKAAPEIIEEALEDVEFKTWPPTHKLVSGVVW